MGSPHNFREILIFVAGATPQIITETIYALSQKNPPIYPDEIYVITTSTGGKYINSTLLKKGILEEMEKEYNLPRIPLTKNSIIVVKDSKGKEINDIRDEIDNEAIGNLITEFIRNKANDPQTRLHCSLAGGRKTMSFYLGSALQLFGRPWDKLYHVLVSPEFESNPGFFYKPKKNKFIECRLANGRIKKLNTKYAKIELTELPFIRLSGKLKLQGKSFKELIEECQKEIDISSMQPSLIVKRKERTIYINNHVINMSPALLMVYITFLRQKIENCKRPDIINCLICTECFSILSDLSTKDVLERMAKDYGIMYGNRAFKIEEYLNNKDNGLSVEQIRQYITKVNKILRDQINDSVIQTYFMITPIKRYGATRYGIMADRRKITIEWNISEIFLFLKSILSFEIIFKNITGGNNGWHYI